MKQFERTDQEPYYPEDFMTEEEYNAAIDRADLIAGEYDDYLERHEIDFKHRRIRQAD